MPLKRYKINVHYRDYRVVIKKYSSFFMVKFSPILRSRSEDYDIQVSQKSRFFSF